MMSFYAGTDRPLPTAAPTPEPGKNIWVIACSTQAPGCQTPALAVQDAGNLLGWETTIFDGELTPSVFNTGIRSAVAAGADAVVLDGVGCDLVKGAISEAREAGVKIYGLYSLDCDDPLVGEAEGQFDSQIDFGPMGTFPEVIENFVGKSQADYAITAMGGPGAILLAKQDDTLFARHVYDGFMREIEAVCGECDVYDVPFTGGDLISGALSSKVSAALAAHPDVEIVAAPYDASILLGIGQAVQGAEQELELLGVEGLVPNLEQIQGSGPQTFAAGLPSERAGWATVDGLIRLFAGEEEADSGIGVQSIDRDHNVPSDSDSYDGNVDASGKARVDYKAVYEQLWLK